jgi:hypothetical protein
MPDKSFFVDLVSRGVGAIDDYCSRCSGGATFDVEYNKQRQAADDAGAPFDFKGAIVNADAAVRALLKADAAVRAITDNEVSRPLDGNHYLGIRRFEGEDAYWRAVKAAYKADPARARALNLPEPPRIGA